MATRFAKTATVMTATIGIIAVLLAYPALTTAVAQTSTSTTTSSSSTTGPWTMGGPGGLGGGWGMGGQGGFILGGPGFGQHQARVNIPVGQTITFTSTSGQYFVVGHSGENGTASGSIVFTVSGNLTQGYTLSISGKVVAGSTTFTIASGSAQMSPSASTISGQGTTSPTGAYIIQGSSRGSFVGSTASVSLDLQSGSTEYIVVLNGAV